ncbi:MAG: dTDP-4-dehydrorhamnose reductase [Nitrospinota bacterium]
MKIAITGASGGLGSRFLKVVKQLYPKWECVGLTHKDADLTQPGKVTMKLLDIKPGVILHTAAMTAVDLCETEKELARAVNVEGVRAVYDAAVKCGAKLVFISTDYVFDGTKEGAYAEDDKTNPINVYGATKLEGERIALRAEGSLVVRTSWLYGPVGKNFISTIYAHGRKGEELKVVNDQTGAPTYHADLATAVARLIKAEASGVINITNSGWCSWYDLAEAVFEEKKMDVKLTAVTSEKFKMAARRPANSRLDCGRYEKITGEKMRHWREAVNEYVAKII